MSEIPTLSLYNPTMEDNPQPGAWTVKFELTDGKVYLLYYKSYEDMSMELLTKSGSPKGAISNDGKLIDFIRKEGILMRKPNES